MKFIPSIAASENEGQGCIRTRGSKISESGWPDLHMMNLNLTFFKSGEREKGEMWKVWLKQVSIGKKTNFKGNTIKWVHL